MKYMVKITSEFVRNSFVKEYTIWSESGWWIFKKQRPTHEYFDSYYKAARRVDELNAGIGWAA